MKLKMPKYGIKTILTIYLFESKIVIVAILLLTITIIACQKEQMFNQVQPKPESDDLKVGYFKSNALDSTNLFKYLKALPSENEHQLGSFLLMKNDELIFEYYWNGYHKNKLHDLRSATKSITSLLVGIAIDKGFIKNEYEPIQNYLPEYSKELEGKSIRIIDLLNMDSGLECDDWVSSSPGNEEKMYSKRDWINFILNQKQIDPRPSNAVYCTGGVVVLGYIIQKASGFKFDEFAKKYLFAPLNISDYSWDYFDRKTKVDAGGHLCLRPRDMLKIGQMFLNKGTFKNSRLLSMAWIEKCESSTVKFRNGESYGYLWWKSSLIGSNKSFDYYYMLGNGGQTIIVMPSEKIVAVFTGQKYNSDEAHKLVKYIMNTVVL